MKLCVTLQMLVFTTFAKSLKFLADVSTDLVPVWPLSWSLTRLSATSAASTTTWVRFICYIGIDGILRNVSPLSRRFFVRFQDTFRFFRRHTLTYLDFGASWSGFFRCNRRSCVVWRQRWLCSWRVSPCSRLSTMRICILKVLTSLRSPSFVYVWVQILSTSYHITGSWVSMGKEIFLWIFMGKVTFLGISMREVTFLGISWRKVMPFWISMRKDMLFWVCIRRVTFPWIFLWKVMLI